MSETNTKILYWIIVISSFVFAKLSQKKIVSHNTKHNFRILPFLISFVIPWFFFAFADISNDYDQYCYIFDTSELSNYNSLWIEPGYALLNALIKFITSDSATAISIIKTIELGIVFFVLYDYRKRVDISLAVWAYLSLSYLDSFCMLRINLSAAIILLALDFYENRHKSIPAICLFITACTIHYSCVMLVIPIGIYLICNRKREFKIDYLIILLVLLVFVRIVALSLMNRVLNAYDFLNKYSTKYGSVEASGSGLMQYIYHIPFIYMYLWLHSKIKKGIVDKNHGILEISLVMVPISLFFGTMGYSFEVIGRSFVFYNYIWVIGMSALVMSQDSNKLKSRLYAVVFIWMLYRFYLYVSDALVPAGIQFYHLSY